MSYVMTSLTGLP
uniref:Uncharacterized protein n=1 Tax=Arundo donax TaxID=35708 RepID=A0A0A9ECU6_ARUDO